VSGREPVHQSLLRHPQLGGVPREYAVAEAVSGLLALFLTRFSWVSLLYLAGLAFLVHPALALVTRNEPLAIPLLLQNLFQPAFRPALGAMGRRHTPPPSALRKR
jgi:type IV secretory pathway TrbD component